MEQKYSRRGSVASALKTIFQELTVSDISQFTIDELLNEFGLQGYQRVLARVFLTNFLKSNLKDSTTATNFGTATRYVNAGFIGDPNFGQVNFDFGFSRPSGVRPPFESRFASVSVPGHGATVNAFQSGFKPINNILNFCGIVQSVTNSSTIPPGTIPIESIESQIKKANGTSPLNITTLDLSNNYLVNSDLKYVLDLAEWTHCKVLKIRLNYIQNIEEAPDASDIIKTFKTILGLEHIQYFDITQNPFASVTNARFFDGLLENDFKKLIFIPKKWLVDDSWQKMVAPKFRLLVAHTHMSYYISSDNPMPSTLPDKGY